MTAAAATATAAAASLDARLNAADAATGALKGRINHSVCKWCYGKIDLDPFCKAAREIGLQSVELVEIKDFPTLKKYGLACALARLRALRPRSLKTCVLLEKRLHRRNLIQPDYIGFRIPNAFVVGYGLDHAEQFRHLPFLGVLKNNSR